MRSLSNIFHGTEDRTQGLGHIRQVLWHQDTPPIFLCTPGWPPTWDTLLLLPQCCHVSTTMPSLVLWTIDNSNLWESLAPKTFGQEDIVSRVMFYTCICPNKTTFCEQSEIYGLEGIFTILCYAQPSGTMSVLSLRFWETLRNNTALQLSPTVWPTGKEEHYAFPCPGSISTGGWSAWGKLPYESERNYLSSEERDPGSVNENWGI